MSIFRKLFGHSGAERRAASLYAGIGAAARQTIYYKDYEVPDTLDGRFDMLMLMQSLTSLILMERDEALIVRDMQEQLIRDMDRNLREIGVGDLSVGKQIKAMGAALIGRQASYHKALKAEDLEALQSAITRNVYKSENSKHLPDFVSHVFALFSYWQKLDTDQIIQNLPSEYPKD